MKAGRPISGLAHAEGEVRYRESVQTNSIGVLERVEATDFYS